MPEETATEPSATDCDPAAVDRPPVVRDSNHPPQGYGTKPRELTVQSVADYLADFETGFAWNRILSEQAPVASLSVNTTTAWMPETADDGFIASSRIETEYANDSGESPTARTYVASYYVSQALVYRAETDSEPVDPRTRADRRLVQCGSDGAGPTPENPTGETPTPGEEVTNTIEYTVRNDDDQSHEIELTIEDPQGDVVHRRGDGEFTTGEQLRGSFTPTDPTDGEYPVTVGLESLSTTVGWRPTECALFDLLVSITPDGQPDIEREGCIK